MNPGAGPKDLLDAYSKKMVGAKWGGKRFEFDVPVSVFSSYQLDLGTLRLLRVLESAGPRWGKALDLGCGYGLIALNLAANGVCREPLGIDRDVLAVEFARRNAERNDFPQCLFSGGLAYGDVPPGDYSAVVSNIPAKAGLAAHRMMLLNACSLVGTTGEVWIVVVSALEQRVEEILRTEGVSVTGKKSFNGHTVYSYRFDRQVPLETAYPPRRSHFEWEGRTLEIDLFEGLAEDDGPSPATLLLASCLSRFTGRSGCRHVAVCDPGQGFVTALLPLLCPQACEISLVSRDALGLKAGMHNLRKYSPDVKCESHHSVSYWGVEMGSGPDVFAAVLNKNEGVEISCRKIAGACLGSPGAAFLAVLPVSRRLRMVKALKSLNVDAREEIDRRGLCVLRCFSRR